MFGQTKPVFGASTTTGFGFGGTQFGASAATNQPSTSLFGNSSTSTQQTSMFGSTVFGAGTTTVQGTTVKFNAPLVNDTIQKNGQKVQVNAKHMCISAMKEYSDKSIEELRVEDYLQNRKSGSTASTKSIFGNTATTPFGFGATQTTSSSLFGSTSTTPTTQSIFGGSNTGSSIFGAAQPMTTFGQTAQNSIFGAKPLFGTSASTNNPLNLSGSHQSQPGFGFGQTPQNSIFGTSHTFGPSTTTSAPLSLFGSQPNSTQSGGFTFGKSTGTNIFGATTTTTSSLFGSSTPTAQVSPFGTSSVSQAGSIFGAAKPTGTSIFGSAATVTTAPTFGSGFNTGFGNKTSGLFGAAPAINTSFSLGSATSSTMQSGLNTGLFGAKKPSPFGSPSNATTPAFGFGAASNTSAPSTNLFGGTTGFGLGATQPAQPAGGIFGTTNFASTGNLFNKPAVNSFGFGQTSSTPSLFNSISSASTGTAVPNLFGSGLAASSSLSFGSATGSVATPFGPAASTNPTILAPLVEQLTQNARAQQHVLEMVRSMPYGQSALFKHLAAETVSTVTSTPTSISPPSTSSMGKVSGVSVLSASAAANTLVELHRANSFSFARSPSHVERGLVVRRPMQPILIDKRQLFTGFQEDDALVSCQSPMPGDRKCTAPEGSQNRPSSASDNRFFVRRETWKRLNIPNCVRTSIIERSSMAAVDFEQQTDGSEKVTSDGVVQKTLRSSRDSSDANFSSTSPHKTQCWDSPTSTPLSTTKSTSDDVREGEKKHLSFTSSSRLQVSDSVGGQSDVGNWTLPPDVTLDQTLPASPEDDNKFVESDSYPTSTANKSDIRLSKSGYYMFPTSEELDGLIDENGRCLVQDFVIGRQSYGHILFPGLTDITGIDFDEVVHIRRREVVVYPDDITKPPQGYGLNRKAEITLDGVWPTDKTTREFIKSPQRLAAIKFDERLEKATQKMGATFIEYRPDTGSWVFEVKHFSKYRLEDSDDEEGHEVPSPSNATFDSHLSTPVDNAQTFDGADAHTDSRTDTNSTKNQESGKGSRNEMSSWQMQLFSLESGRSSRTFNKARHSLFSSENQLDKNEVAFRMDDDLDFLSRRSRIGLAIKTPPPAEFEASLPHEMPDNNFSKREQTSPLHVEEFCDTAQHLLKLQVLHSVHNPFPCDPLPDFKLDQKSLSLPYKRIGELVAGVSPLLTDLRGCYFDAGLCRGGVVRPSWSLVRRKGEPSQLVILNIDPSIVSGDSLVVRSIPSTLDTHEELFLNSALQTSVQKSLEAGSSSCPQFYPEVGQPVLDIYLTSAATKEGLSARMQALRRALLLCQSLWARYSNYAGTGAGGDADDALGLHDHFVSRRMHHVLEEESLCRGSMPLAMNELARRQAVSEWIRAELRPWLDSRLQELGLAQLIKAEVSSQEPWSFRKHVHNQAAVFSGIFACLCCGEPAVACRLALVCQMSHLASCLSMAAISDPLCKKALKRQLRVWNDLKVLHFMPRQILRIYALLAGELKVSISDTKGKTFLNVFAGVPYLQALGVHLWYLVDYSTDLSTALKLFSHNWQACDTGVAPPHPPEYDADRGVQYEVRDAPLLAMPSRASPRDICYHLLRLASRPWHSLERTLDPRSIRNVQLQQAHTELASDDSDWPSAWHLWRVLVSIGFSSLNPIATSRLHVEMATHLEAVGLWEWAVFALMHEVEPKVRSASVKQLLARHVTLRYPLRTDEMHWRLDEESANRFNKAEAFVVKRFGVPAKWIHEAKASLARSLLTSRSASADVKTHRLLASLEAAHWLAAGHLEAAHVVYMKFLLPDIMLRSHVSISSILNDSHVDSSSASLASKLQTVLQPFDTIPQESLPPSFDLGVGVYLVYTRALHLAHQFALSRGGNGEPEGSFDAKVNPPLFADAAPQIVEELRVNTLQLVHLLQSMPTPSVRDRVVKSEMAAAAVRLISAVLHDHSIQTINSIPSQGGDASAMSIDSSFPSVDKKVVLLCQRLNLISSIDSPQEIRLNELETLAASGIAQCIF